MQMLHQVMGTFESELTLHWVAVLWESRYRPNVASALKHYPASADPQTLLALASEHRSVRTALAALRLVATAGASVCGGGRGCPAGRGVVVSLLPAAQQLVLLMVHHADADVRAAACRALQSVVRCLNPGTAPAGVNLQIWKVVSLC